MSNLSLDRAESHLIFAEAKTGENTGKEDYEMSTCVRIKKRALIDLKSFYDRPGLYRISAARVDKR